MISQGSGWTITFQSRRVETQWEDLASRVPTAALRCRSYLENTPMQRLPKRVYPWRGSRADGRWEYEVDGGDRVIYIPNPEEHQVVIIYAGKHPSTYANR